MNKHEIGLFKALAALALIAVGVGVIYTIGRIMLVGFYLETAPLPLTIFVGVILPLLIVWAVARAIIALWRAK